MRRLFLLAAIILFAVLASACGGGGNSPTAPSAPSVGGIWNGTEVFTAISGGECTGASYQQSVGLRSPFTLSIEQTGSSVSATRTYTANGAACSLSGSASGNSVVLNLSNCQIGSYLGLRCSNGAVRDIRIVSGSFTGTVAGSGMSGTYAETWNVFQAGTATGVGILTLNSTFTATR